VIGHSYPQNNEYAPRTWKGLKLANGGRSASFTCPKCGQTAVLIDHEINADGTVRPSVVCPTENCDFHEWIVLGGWARRR
jgi:predicted RNA-binding Zn-ribbon protein involved in translation (DUF1610 family)